MLEFSGLADKRDELAGNLAFGEQRRLELARALAAKPKLLLLDEPAAGMNLEEVQASSTNASASSTKQGGITMLLVEHVMELVMGVTDRIAVLNFGSKIAEGTPEEIQKNDRLCSEAYLGSSVESPPASLRLEANEARKRVDGQAGGCNRRRHARQVSATSPKTTTHTARSRRSRASRCRGVTEKARSPACSAPMAPARRP